jgi:uncharacterized Fe-S cluster-containing radical SAM superfamily protein
VRKKVIEALAVDKAEVVFDGEFIIEFSYLIFGYEREIVNDFPERSPLAINIG